MYQAGGKNYLLTPEGWSNHRGPFGKQGVILMNKLAILNIECGWLQLLLKNELNIVSFLMVFNKK